MTKRTKIIIGSTAVCLAAALGERLAARRGHKFHTLTGAHPTIVTLDSIPHQTPSPRAAGLTTEVRDPESTSYPATHAKIDSAKQFDRAFLDVELKYGRAILKLKGWTPNRLEELKRKLAAQEVAMMNVSIPDKVPVTDTERSAFASSLRSAYASSQDELRQYMGDSDYANFSAATAIETYRPDVSAAVNAMRSNGLAIDNDTEEAVLFAYSQGIQEAASQNAKIIVADLSDDEKVEIKAQQERTLNLALMKKVGAVLDEHQTQEFMYAILER